MCINHKRFNKIKSTWFARQSQLKGIKIGYLYCHRRRVVIIIWPSLHDKNELREIRNKQVKKKITYSINLFYSIFVTFVPISVVKNLFTLASSFPKRFYDTYNWQLRYFWMSLVTYMTSISKSWSSIYKLVLNLEYFDFTSQRVTK